MGFRFVLLWTDAALWALVLALAAYGWRVARHENLRATWARIGRDAPALCSALALAVFALIALTDSIHLRRALPGAGEGAATPQFEARTESVLELLLARQLAMRETSYSAPLAWRAFATETVVRDGRTLHEYPRLAYGGAHLADPARDWAGDVGRRALTGAAAGLGVALAVLALALGAVGLATRRGWRALLADFIADRTRVPWRALWLTLVAIAVALGVVIALMGHYHVYGTDRTGNDVFVQALKSVRTAFVLGLLATLATLPVAVSLGIVAGWYGGFVDEAVQYLYTTLSSVPNVLLIAACVLMLQVALDKHPDWFETGLERADVKVFMLCAILGLTGWATLCRLVRAETLKLRELEFVQAATAFGITAPRIMARHILPNVAHLVLITTVLSFSDLILYEAVLTYVGVGVDPSMNSFGGMINLARSEMSRDPVVWWSFIAAFGGMVTLVLAANLFADGVRDAFDPRARAMRSRFGVRKADPS